MENKKKKDKESITCMSSFSYEWKGMNPSYLKKSCAKSGANSSLALLHGHLPNITTLLIPDC